MCMQRTQLTQCRLSLQTSRSISECMQVLNYAPVSRSLL